MNSSTKQTIAGGVDVFCAIVMVFCISRMVPYGLSGDLGKAIGWIVLAVIAFIVSLSAGVAYYYYRGRKQDQGLERMHIEVDVLAHAGHKPDRPTSAYPELDQPKKDKKSING